MQQNKLDERGCNTSRRMLALERQHNERWVRVPAARVVEMLFRLLL